MIMMMIPAKIGVAKKTSVSSQLHLAQPGRQQGRTCGRDRAPDINAIVVAIIISSRLSIIVIISERVRDKSLLSRLRTAVRIPIPINNTSHTFANTSNHKISIEYEYVITIIKYQVVFHEYRKTIIKYQVVFHKYRITIIKYQVVFHKYKITIIEYQVVFHTNIK